ncbi:TPA: mediator of DNA damage checkpoint 1-like [Bos taurus]|nr:TPA: mediator of DNA damage checkpoint 1-like [Bos taurus]
MEDTQILNWEVEEEEEVEERPSESLRCSLEPLGQLRIFSSSYGPEKDFPLYLGKNMIGRMPDCSVALPFSSISKQHAVIEISAWDKAPVLRDCGSLNGTQILRPPKVLGPGMSHPRQPGAAARDSDPSRDLGRKRQLLGAGPALPISCRSSPRFCLSGPAFVTVGALAGPVGRGRPQEQGWEDNGFGSSLPYPNLCPTLPFQPVPHPGLQRENWEIWRKGDRVLREGGGGLGPRGVAAAQRSPEGAADAQTPM